MQANVLHYKASEVRYTAYYSWTCSIVDLYTEIYLRIHWNLYTEIHCNFNHTNILMP
jgi:hypothetical protein